MWRLLFFIFLPVHGLVICFSGTPGMGKSTLARALEERLEATVVCTDELRRRGVAFEPEKLCEIEGTVILDASIDRRLPQLRELGLDLVVIRLWAPREEVERRLIQREENPELFLRHLDKWWDDYSKLQVADAFFFDTTADWGEQLAHLFDYLGAQHL